MRVTLGGAEVDLLGRDEVLRRLLRRLVTHDPRDPLFLASANLDHVHHFGLDSGREGFFDDARGGADWLVLLDGVPLVWAARRLTGGDWERLAGSDLLEDVLRTAARARASVGFLGGTDEQHQLLATKLAQQFPALDVVGWWAPPREVVEDRAASERLAKEIAGAGVDLLVVGLGKPRQEEWLRHHGRATGVRAAVAFGAASDFLAGIRERAPERWRELGLEWLYRLLREPRRLARRYLVQGPSSLYRVLAHSEAPAMDEEGSATPALVTPHAWRRRLGRALAAADAVVIGLSSAAAYGLRAALGEIGVVPGLESEIPAALGVLPLWLTLLYVLGAYRPEYLNTGADATRRFVAGTAAGVLVLGFVSFLLNLQLSRLYVALLAGLVLTLGGAVRLMVRAYLRSRRARGRFTQRVLIVGADEEGRGVADALGRDEESGYRVVGFLDDDLPVGTGVLDGLEVLGSPGDALDVAYDTRAGLVLLSPTGVPPGTLADLTVALEGSPVDLAVAPSLFQVVSRRMTVETVANVPIVHLDQVRLTQGRAVAKRTLDLVVATGLVLLTWPLMLAAAAAIRLESPGPVVFSQRRVGRDGRRFTLYKFRTMVPGADERLRDVEHLNEVGHGFFKIREDPRVTRVGRLLRKWSVDELPQLWNVLRGDMSMVGPRPALPREVDDYEPWQLRRLRVRPGITGVWQVSGRSTVPFEEAVRMDLFYIENWSLGTDLFLLGRTVLAVLGRTGAY